MEQNIKLPIKKHLGSLVRIPNAANDGQKYLRLDKNENHISFPQEFLSEIKQLITADFVSTYPELSSLANSIASSLGCKTNNIYLTAGSDAAIKSIFEIFINPGEQVAILNPTYAMYYVYAQIFQADLIKIDCNEALSFSPDEICTCIAKQKPKLICLANPNSPTGTIINPNNLESIIKAAYKYSTIILVDEAYYLYYPKSVVRLINKYPNLVITRTFSKAYGLASARVGYAVGSKEMIAMLHKVRPMYEVNAIGAKFVEHLLEHPTVTKKNVSLALKAKKYLEHELDKMGLSYFKSYANFVLIDVGSFEKSFEIVEELKTHKILIKGAFSHQHLKKCIRVTIGPSEQMRRFIRALKGTLK